MEARVGKVGSGGSGVRFSLLAAVLLVVVSGLVGGSAPPAQAALTDGAGYRDFSYGTGANSPTAEKPQSKLWFNDGTWWGILFDPVSQDYHIWRFDKQSQGWTDTGTLVDKRHNSKADALWDGTNLYVASAPTSTSTTDQGAYVSRYAYDAATKRYSLSPGFPATVASGPIEAIVLDKDTTGKLWVTYTQTDPVTQETRVYINRSVGGDASWGTPFVLPVAGTTVAPDDISSVVAFDLQTAAPQIGVVWSNQVDNALYFSAHKDGAPDDVWQPSVKALQGPGSADDHISLRSLQADSSGRVYAAVKTTINETTNPDPNAPLIELVVLGQDGNFSSQVFGRVADDHTRPIVMIDEQNRNVYVFATVNAPTSASGGTIYYKKAPLNNISFPEGRGTPFIQSSTDTTINNATSTKQSVNSQSGLLVLASDNTSRYYLHNSIDLTPPPDATPPKITIVTPTEGASYALDQVVNASYSCADETGGSGMKSCAGPVASGAAIDTNTTGTKSFTVTATDNAGNTASATRSYTVTGGPQPPGCTINGTSGNDTLNGTTGSDVICGLAGNDTIKGLGGDDVLRGDDGTDKVYGGTGNDTLDGGAGTDTASYSSSGAAVVVSLVTNAATGEGSDSLAGIENLSGSSRNDALTGSGGVNNLAGNGGADEISGAGGADKLAGDGGADTIRGGTGNDSVVGGSEADKLFGDEDNDSVNSRDGVNGNDALDGGPGTVDTRTTDTSEASIVGFP